MKMLFTILLITRSKKAGISSIWNEGISTFCLWLIFRTESRLKQNVSKIRQEKFIKILNYIKFSCIIFCHDIFYCSQYILFTKLKYFWSGDIRSVITAWNIKTRKFIMIFFLKLYQVFMCQNVLIFSICYSQKE